LQLISTIPRGLIDNQDGTVTLEEMEANYGYIDVRDSVARAGIIFEVSHGAGDDYGEALFCSFDGVSYDAETTFQSGDPAVNVDRDTGQINEAQLERVREFVEARKRALAYLAAVQSEEVAAC
jgi:hypothetical protein